MADIVSGHGDALEHDGMAAKSRWAIPGLIVMDPDAHRSSNNDHHTGPGG